MIIILLYQQIQFVTKYVLPARIQWQITSNHFAITSFNIVCYSVLYNAKTKMQKRNKLDLQQYCVLVHCNITFPFKFPLLPALQSGKSQEAAGNFRKLYDNMGWMWTLGWMVGSSQKSVQSRKHLKWYGMGLQQYRDT